MPQDFDLFGDPIPENHGKRGRPEHIPTRENRNKVSLLLAFGWGDERIARALHVTPPTLRKHYFSELRFRDEARDRMDARRAAVLWKEVETGSIPAFKAFDQFVQRNDLMLYGQHTRPVVKEKKVKAVRLGKKEKAAQDAQNPDAGTTLGQLMAQRQAKMN